MKCLIVTFDASKNQARFVTSGSQTASLLLMEPTKFRDTVLTPGKTYSLSIRENTNTQVGGFKLLQQPSAPFFSGNEFFAPETTSAVLDITTIDPTKKYRIACIMGVVNAPVELAQTKSGAEFKRTYIVARTGSGPNDYVDLELTVWGLDPNPKSSNHRDYGNCPFKRISEFAKGQAVYLCGVLIRENARTNDVELSIGVYGSIVALKVDKDHLTTQFADLEAWYARTVNVGLAAGFTLPPGEVADVDVDDDDAGGAASSSAAASSPQDKEDKGSATKRGAKSSSSPPSSSSSAAKRAKKGA